MSATQHLTILLEGFTAFAPKDDVIRFYISEFIMRRQEILFDTYWADTTPWPVHFPFLVIRKGSDSEAFLHRTRYRRNGQLFSGDRGFDVAHRNHFLQPKMVEVHGEILEKLLLYGLSQLHNTTSPAKKSA